MEPILNSLLQDEDWANYNVTSDQDANLIVVRATPDIHQIFQEIITELDQPTENPSTPLRIYKLQNAKAIEVFYTLQALQELALPSMAGGLGYSPFNPFGISPAGTYNAAAFGSGSNPYSAQGFIPGGVPRAFGGLPDPSAAAVGGAAGQLGDHVATIARAAGAFYFGPTVHATARGPTVRRGKQPDPGKPGNRHVAGWRKGIRGTSPRTASSW